MAHNITNANVARIILASTIAAFLYYFLWVSVVPFLLVDEGKLVFKSECRCFVCRKPPLIYHFLSENWIFSLFPPLAYAFILPVASGTLFISSLAAYTLYQVHSHFAVKKNTNPRPVIGLTPMMSPKQHQQ